MKFEEREQINRPSGEVYLALSRPDLYLSKWSRGVLSVVAVESAAGDAPRTYKITGRDLAGKAHWHYEVLACEAGTTFTARSVGGPISFNDRFTLHSVSDGTTEVIHAQELHPKGLFTLLGPILPYVWPSLIRRNLGKLKSVMEMRKSPVPSLAQLS